MSDMGSNFFFEHVVRPAQAGDAFIAEVGGLPEISRASKDIHTAISQTRHEIEDAVFDQDRFPDHPTAADSDRMRGFGINLTSFRGEAYETEGMAGIKRSRLKHDLDHIERELSILMHRLVELRCDLRVSESDFGRPLEPVTAAENPTTI